MLIAIAPTRKNAIAAARLTFAYGAAVALLLAPMLGVVGAVTEGLALLASPLGAWLAVTFILLATARRAAFVALWLLTLVVWVWHWESMGPRGYFAGGGFTLWSLVAAPLYAMTVVGFGAARPASLARRIAWTLGIGGWLAAAAAGITYMYGFRALGCWGGVATTGMPLVDGTIQATWLAMPPLVALDAIRRARHTRRIAAPVE